MEVGDDFRNARGIFQWKEGDEKAEDTIRRGRGDLEAWAKEVNRLRAKNEQLKNAITPIVKGAIKGYEGRRRADTSGMIEILKWILEELEDA